MAGYIIMTDSCCDLSAEMAAELELEVLPLRLELEGQSYRNLLDGSEIGFQEFYRRVRDGALPVTSAVNVGEFDAAMRPVLESGRDILCLCFSSALSTTYQSAVIAAKELEGEFPGRNVLVMDTLCASEGQGLLIWLCAQEKRRGKSLEELWDYALDMRGHICQWFTVNDLNHLKRGGRVSATAALFGTMLSIKPVLHVDDQGRLIPMEKCRGRRASLTALVDHMEKTAVDPERYPVFISHGDCLEDAEFVAEEVRRRLGVKEIYCNYVGPVIGSHTGAGVVTLFFVGNSR
ncbi:MAG: DegV family protein [Oscillibacter sp.]|jgi:DegV family protein with EDD domain|nr:DegV family protein [Oscillibacter sp.]